VLAHRAIDTSEMVSAAGYVPTMQKYVWGSPRLTRHANS
jgi:hypothetical protein